MLFEREKYMPAVLTVNYGDKACQQARCEDKLSDSAPDGICSRKGVRK
jgi:hypothetical protein